jgi:hypothetical protein
LWPSCGSYINPYVPKISLYFAYPQDITVMRL